MNIEYVKPQRIENILHKDRLAGRSDWRNDVRCVGENVSTLTMIREVNSSPGQETITGFSVSLTSTLNEHVAALTLLCVHTNKFVQMRYDKTTAIYPEVSVAFNVTTVVPLLNGKLPLPEPAVRE